MTTSRSEALAITRGWVILCPALALAVVACSEPELVGPPALFTKVGGDSQTAPTHTRLPITPTVLVRDANGDPIGLVPVIFTVTSGEGLLGDSIRQDSVVTTLNTAADGTARASWMIGGAGANTLSAEVSGLQVIFTATGTSGPLAKLVKVAGEQRVAAALNSPVPIPPRVRATDTYDNGIPGLTIRFYPTTLNSATIVDSMPTTDSLGYAAVGSLTPTAPGIFGVSASSPGVGTLFYLSAVPPAITSLSVGTGGGKCVVAGTTGALCWGPGYWLSGSPTMPDLL